MVHAVALWCALLSLPAASRAKAAAEPAPAPGAALKKVAIMPVLAKNGASQGIGLALSQLLAASLGDRKDLAVEVYDPVSYGMRDPLIPVLARCPDLGCAVELGGKLQVDEIVVGTLDGNADPKLVMWRVHVADSSVAGIFETTLSEAEQERLSRAPEIIVTALLAPPGQQRAPATPTLARAPGATGATSHAAPADVSTPARDSILRAALRVVGGVGVGAAVTAVMGALVLLLGYGGVALYDRASVSRTGRHTMPRRLSLMVDSGAVTVGVLGVMALPVAAAGVAAVVATYLMPAGL